MSVRSNIKEIKHDDNCIYTDYRCLHGIDLNKFTYRRPIPAQKLKKAKKSVKIIDKIEPIFTEEEIQKVQDYER